MGPDTIEHRSFSSRLHTAYWLLLTTLFGLPLITPLLSASSVPCTHDGHLHYHRVAAMAHAWDNGIYLTRWLPDLAFGYGYPFFVYREAAPLYAVLVPFLAGMPLPAASNLFYAVTILLCGIFMFLWVRDLFGPRAGLVSAVAYMGAPYVLVDALIRGNSPESLALPLLPLILWAGRRWVLFGSTRYFLIGALGLALLSFGHNISTFIFAPTLAVYLVALVVKTGRQATGDGRRSVIGGRLFRVVLLLGLGLGLAFFYTGGAVLEMDQVTLEMSTTSRNNDWRNNFASLGEILSPVAAEDPALVNPPLLFRLGWVPLLLAAIGVTGLAWIKGSDARAREQRLHIWLMAIGAAVYLFMALPVSRWLWEIVPLIDFVQFPWRFVGRAALPVAFLAGVPFYYFDRTRQTVDDRPQTTDSMLEFRRPSSIVPRRWMGLIITIAALALLIIETIPNLYPRMCMEEPFPTILTVHNYERVTGLVGVDPEGSYFPRTVGERPSGSPLETDFVAGQTPQRFDATVLPNEATIRDVTYGRSGVTLTVDTPQTFTARYLSFTFPGWSARVDGQKVAITPEDPSGLITFPIPAGTHRIEVEWGSTPLRLALVGLSVLSAAGIVAVVVGAWRRPQTADNGRGTSPHDRFGRGAVAILIIMGVGLLSFKAFTDRNETFLRRIGTSPVQNPATLQGGELRLDGFNLSRDRVPAGETFAIDLAWTAVAPPSVDYQSEISIVGIDGLAWSQKGTERPRVFEDAPNTLLWSAGEWGWDNREVRLLTGAPPGTYDIVVTLFDKATLAPVTLIDTTQGQAVGPTAVIGQIEIANPDQPPDFAAQYSVEHEFPALGLRLLGYNQDRTAAAPGESVLLTLFWECADFTACERFTLRLQDETGTDVETWTLPVMNESFLPEDWPAHGRLRGQYLVQLPASLAGGRYRFLLEEFPLDAITVAAPERAFAAPELAREIEAGFITADGTLIATLVGVAADSSSPSCIPAPKAGVVCTLALVWRADNETPTSYHVFVHLVDETGAILAQADAVPAGWTRPTTGWLPGEYIVDSHTLMPPADLPPQPLSLRVGLYNPDTGERLTTGVAEFATMNLP